MKNNTPNPLEKIVPFEAFTSLSRLVNTVSAYQESHPASRQTVNAALDALQPLFLDANKVSIAYANRIVSVNETPVRVDDTLPRSLERHLARLRVAELYFRRGVTKEELIAWAKILAGSGADDFKANLLQAKLEHVGAFIRLPPPDPGAGLSSASDEYAAQLKAYLEDVIDLSDPEWPDRLADIAHSPEFLERILLQAVLDALDEQPETSARDIAANYLRRLFDALRNQSFFRGAEGLMDLKKMLRLLKEEFRIDSKLHGSEVEEPLLQALDETGKFIDFELTAARYVEYHDAIIENEKQLLGIIRAKSADRAEELLSRFGLSQSDIENVSDRIDADGERQTAPIDRLANLVLRERESASREEPIDDSHISLETLDALSHQLTEAQKGTGTIGGEAARMDRKELLSALAEVAQELMQPLTCINATLEMLLSGYAGEVKGERRELIGLAANSGEHLRFLMDGLISIVGIPSNKGVDDRFHTNSDQVIRQGSASTRAPLHDDLAESTPSLFGNE